MGLKGDGLRGELLMQVRLALFSDVMVDVIISPCHKAQNSMAVTALVAELLTKKLICSEGRGTKDFGSIYYSVLETLPQMLKKHAATDGVSRATTEKGKIGETFGYPFAQSFPCAGASFHRNTCIFHLTKGRFSTGCITIGDVQQVDSGIG